MMKLWNKNFFLLWQGQLVSCLGDVLYSLALGFWVLEKTGSTALMGVIMASTSIPRIILGPFSGVLVDRFDRKKMIILGDFIRGVVVIFTAIGAIYGFLEVWMVMIAGVLLGSCASFFDPSISSVLPDIVPKDKIMKANSVYSMATTTTKLLGNICGGFLYAIIGAPFMFLINGISYIISAITESFIDVPKTKTQNKKFTFKQDIKEGFGYIRKFKGITSLISISLWLNFLYSLFCVLIMPFFIKEAHLGISKYGILISLQGVGMILGSVILSFINVKYEDRYKLCATSIIIMPVCSFMAIALNNFYLMCVLFCLSFIFNVFFNTIATSNVQSIIPNEYRGKVMSLLITASTAIAPLGLILGGVLAEYISIRYVMMGSMVVCFLVAVTITFNKNIKVTLNYNPENDKIESLMSN